MKSIIFAISFCIFFNSFLMSQDDKLLNYNEFSKLNHTSKFKYLNDSIYSFKNYNFPEAAYSYFFRDGGSSRVTYYPNTTDILIISNLIELQSIKYKKSNILNTVRAIKEIYKEPILSNNFYYNDEFGDGMNCPYIENYYRFNDSIYLRTMIFFQQRSDLFKVNSEYNTEFILENIYKESKFDLHLTLYHKDLVKSRMKYLIKEYSKRKKFKDYSVQINIIDKFLKKLNLKK